MRLRTKCHSCGKKKILVFKRVFDVKLVGEITSQNPLCSKCKNSIIKMLGDQMQ